VPPEPPVDENEVHVLQADRSAPRRGRLALLLGLAALVLVGGAGAYLWLNPDLLGSPATEEVQALPPAAGNLLGDGWSFESGDAGSAFSFWSVPDDAPAGFEVLPAGARRGALGAVARPGEAGWCRLASQALPLGAHRGAVRLSASVRGADVALLLRFEAPGRPPVERAVAAGEGDLSGAALVPPGAASVRAVLQSAGEGSLDDVELRLLDAGEARDEQRLDRGGFQVTAAGAHLLVWRGDELALEAPGLSLRVPPAESLPPVAARAPSADGELLFVPGGCAGRSTVSLQQDARALTLAESLHDLSPGVVPVRTLLVGGSLAQAPVGLVSAGGFETFSGDFRVEAVRSLVLGRTQDRLVVELDEGAVTGTRQADGRWLLRAELPAGAAGSTLVVRTNFQDERVQAAQHRDAALAAQAAGRLGAALAEAETVVTRYPHDEEVLGRAAQLRGQLLAELQARLERIDRDLQDALFLASARRCREVLADCEVAAATWAGSAAADTFRERGRLVALRAADLLEADRARRATALQAVADSFREAGDAAVADEIDDTLARWLQPAAEGGR
jgi:hypothetical protein